MDRSTLAALLVAAGLAAGAVGCTPHIGDHCNLDTDCSITGTLFCDTSEPNGYCTFFNCGPNSCQDNAVCVLLSATVPGCPYDDYQSPSRTGRTMCLKSCQQDSDCRDGEGYVCADPTQTPWNALIVDSYQGQHVCLVSPDYDAGALASYADAGVCQSSGPPVPPIDAGVNLVDAGGPTQDAGAETGTDAGADAGLDAEADALADAAGDATIDEGADAGVDATVDAPDGD